MFSLVILMPLSQNMTSFASAYYHVHSMLKPGGRVCYRIHFHARHLILKVHLGIRQGSSTGASLLLSPLQTPITGVSHLSFLTLRTYPHESQKIEPYHRLVLRFVCLLAAPEGLARFSGAHPDVPVWTASIDECLNEHGYIMPGLGDAGDRMYGTR